jgi:hypothetical protein
VGCIVILQLWPNAYVNALTVIIPAMQFWWDLLVTNSTYKERNTETVRAQLLQDLSVGLPPAYVFFIWLIEKEG